MGGGGQYVGARPNRDGSFVDKKWLDDRYDAVGVTSAYVTSRARAEAASTTADATPLVDTAYVDQRDALRAKRADVDAADALLVPLSSIGQPGGVATLDSQAHVPAGQLPTLVPERVPFQVSGATVYLGQQDVTTSGTKTFQAATLSVPDPGYPYFVLPVTSVRGRCSAQTHGPRRVGGGSYGKAAVLTQNDWIVAGGISGGQFDWDWTHLVPYGAPQAVPGSNSVLSGTTTLSLWLSLWSGTSYTYDATGMVFWSWVVPAL